MHKLTIPQVQALVGKVKKRLPQEQVIVAGGVLRDIICGKPVKDIDFFITGGPHEFFAYGLYDWLNEEFAIGWHKGDGKAVKGFKNPGASVGHGYGGSKGANYKEDLFVAEYANGWYGIPCQFVFVWEGAYDSQRHDWVHEDLRAGCMKRFDFGLTRIWCDETRLRWTPEFEQDRANRRLTFYGSGWGKTSHERLERLRKKYSDYRFVNRSGAPLPTAS